MIFHWPQYTWLVLLWLRVLVHASRDGKPMGNYNVGSAIGASAIGFFLLYFGGFFSGAGVPQ